MDDQKDNALSINICIKYKLVVFEPRHTKAVFLTGETKRILLHFHLIVTNYYVHDRNVRNAPQIGTNASEIENWAKIRHKSVMLSALQFIDTYYFFTISISIKRMVAF